MSPPVGHLFINRRFPYSAQGCFVLKIRVVAGRDAATNHRHLNFTTPKKLKMLDIRFDRCIPTGSTIKGSTWRSEGGGRYLDLSFHRGFFSLISVYVQMSPFQSTKLDLLHVKKYDNYI